jgi:hypothetical protein
MSKTAEIKRLYEIVEGASKLPIENQEYILTTIKGMLFTKQLLLKQNQQLKINKNHSA